MAAALRRKFCSLVLLRDPASARILLGHKKHGFGAGKLNGFGGKVEPGETLLRCALREMEEESGLALQPAELRHVGFLTFHFAGREGEELHVHVFAAQRSAGAGGAAEPVETDEMAPVWVPEAAVPFASMWADDKHWFPHLLAGGRFRGVFTFAGHEEITAHTLEAVAEGAGLCEYVEDPASCVLLPVGSAAQGAIDF